MSQNLTTHALCLLTLKSPNAPLQAIISVFKGFYQSIFAFVDEVLAQSSVDKERLESLGEKITCFGNLKMLNTQTLSATYAKPNRPIFCAASTHKGEEADFTKALKPFVPTHNPKKTPRKKPHCFLSLLATQSGLRKY